MSVSTWDYLYHWLYGVMVVGGAAWLLARLGWLRARNEGERLGALAAVFALAWWWQAAAVALIVGSYLGRRA